MVNLSIDIITGITVFMLAIVIISGVIGFLMYISANNDELYPYAFGTTTSGTIYFLLFLGIAVWMKLANIEAIPFTPSEIAGPLVVSIVILAIGTFLLRSQYVESVKHAEYYRFSIGWSQWALMMLMIQIAITIFCIGMTLFEKGV